MCVFLIVAVLTSQLTARARDEADAGAAARGADRRALRLQPADRRRRRHRRPAAGGRASTSPSCSTPTSRCCCPDATQLVQRASHPRGHRARRRRDRGRGVGAAARRGAGRGTDTLPGGDWIFVPLDTARGVVGVLGVRRAAAERTLPLDQRQLLEALARQAAIAIERTRIDVVLEEKAKTEAVMEAIEDGLDRARSRRRRRARQRGRLRDPRGRARATCWASASRRWRAAIRTTCACARPCASSARHPDRAKRERVEIALFLRGRDHHFVLRPTPFATPRRGRRRADPGAAGRHLLPRPGGAARAPGRDAVARAAARRSPRCAWRSSCSRRGDDRLDAEQRDAGRRGARGRGAPAGRVAAASSISRAAARWRSRSSARTVDVATVVERVAAHLRARRRRRRGSRSSAASRERRHGGRRRDQAHLGAVEPARERAALHAGRAAGSRSRPRRTTARSPSRCARVGVAHPSERARDRVFQQGRVTGRWWLHGRGGYHLHEMVHHHVAKCPTGS